MRGCLFFIAFLLSFGTIAQNDVPADLANNTEVSNKLCSEVKNGTYRVKHGIFGLTGKTYIIKRENNQQIEVDSYGDKYIFDVVWISDCSYELTLREIVNNPGHVEISDKPILVEITEIMTDGYKNKVTMVLDGLTVVKTNTMINENPNQHTHLQEYLNGTSNFK